MPLCECGCGQEIKEGKRFVLGHFLDPKRHENWTEERIQKGRETRRLNKEFKEGKIELPFCACGCGERVTKFTKKYIRGHWKRGLTKENDERVRNNAEGISKGRLKFFQTERGQKWLDEHQRGENNYWFRNRELLRGKNNPNYGKPTWKKGLTKETSEGVAKHARALCKLWKDPEYVKKIMTGLNVKPNKFELEIGNLLQKLFPNEYAYNGDFSLGVTISGRIPDFVNINGQKKVIECFGDWWHRDDDVGNKIFHYKLFGFDCLVIWDCELKDKKVLISKIRKFHKS